MGMKQDMKCRVRKVRKDSDRRQRHICEVRTLIFQQGVGVNGARVQQRLNDKSYVLTTVFHQVRSDVDAHHSLYRTLSQGVC